MRYHVHMIQQLPDDTDMAITISVDADDDAEAQEIAFQTVNGLFDVTEIEYDDDEYDPFRSDAEADADALASAGWGTDEDYGSAEDML